MLPVPQDRTSGRRSSSIGCRSIVGRRTSTYITPSASCDPFKHFSFNRTEGYYQPSSDDDNNDKLFGNGMPSDVTY